MRTFEFKKTYEEIGINGETYRLDFADQKLLQYQKEFRAFQLKTVEMDEKAKTLETPEQELEFFEETKQLVKEIIDVFLGEGSFDKIYEQSGGSIFNVIELVMVLGEIVEERMAKEKNEKLNKYLKNKKKK
jgi:hypothetical protein